MEIKRVITVTVLNEHGVLSRISGLFAGRGYNIESLTVAPIFDTNLSRITITTQGDKKVLEQILKQMLFQVLLHYLDLLMNLKKHLLYVDVVKKQDSMQELLMANL